MAENQIIAAQQMLRNQIQKVNEDLKTARDTKHRVQILKKLNPIIDGYYDLYNTARDGRR